MGGLYLKDKRLRRPHPRHAPTNGRHGAPSPIKEGEGKGQDRGLVPELSPVMEGEKVKDEDA